MGKLSTVLGPAVVALSAVFVMGSAFKANAEDVFSGTAWKNRAGILTVSFGDTHFCPANTNKCYKLETTGFGGSSSVFEMSFQDGEFLTDAVGKKAELTCTDGQKSQWNRLPEASLSTLNEGTKNGSIKLVDLPQDIRLSYAAKTQDGDYLFVTEDRNAKDYYKSFRFFTFHGSKMTEHAVDDVMRFRDGGTTSIKTSAGVFYSPSPFKRGEDSTFNQKPISSVTEEEVTLMLLEIPNLMNKKTNQTLCSLMNGQK